MFKTLFSLPGIKSKYSGLYHVFLPAAVSLQSSQLFLQKLLQFTVVGWASWLLPQHHHLATAGYRKGIF